MLLLPALLLGAPTAATALPPVPHAHAVRATTPPVLDGKLDDDVWTSAPVAGGFTQYLPNDGQPPTDPTTVRVLYDDDNVYIGVDCPQPHASVVERLSRRDRQVESDAIAIELGTKGDRKSAFEFWVNASGTIVDAIRYNDTESSPDWDENWEARTHVTPAGWSAEYRIPLRILRYRAGTREWDFQVYRWISLKQELSQWSYYPRTAAGEVSHYGRLEGLDGLAERTPIEFRPFVVGRLRRRDPGDANGEIASGTDFLASAGLDLKWHPTQDLTLDATFNPDFAQVEADQVVLNLTTVETYYPEKRPFFLEGIDTFTTPFQLLYTRRIGHVPPLPSLRTDPVNAEQLYDLPEPSTIYGASKLTGRLSDRWSIGTVQAVTAANSVQVQLGSGARVTRLVDPTSTFNLVRLKREVGDNAHIGVMLTAVTHAEQTENYPLVAPGPYSSYPGTTELCPTPVFLTPFQQTTRQPAPLSRCFNDAYTGAVDWRWRSSTGDYAVGGQVASTVLENGPPRPIADGTLIHPGDLGVGGKAYVRKEGGKHWVGSTDVDLESTAFDVNDLGYNERANQYEGEAQLEYRDLDPHGPFLETHESLYFGTQYDARGLLIGQGTHLGVSGRFTNFWWYDAGVYYRGNKYDDREVGDGTALQRDGAIGSWIAAGTDSTKRLSASLNNLAEAVFDGTYVNGTATITMRVLPQWDFDLLPTWQWAHGETRFLPGAPEGAALGTSPYLFGHLDAKSLGATLRTTYTFLPRLTLQAYAQLFLASGHYSGFTQFQADPKGPRPAIVLSELVPYTSPLGWNPDFEEGVLNVNLVLRWEYVLGSTAYLVYTRSQIPTTTLGASDIGTLNVQAIGHAPASDVVLAKVSFWWGR
jgi:hypothetical protein